MPLADSETELMALIRFALDSPPGSPCAADIIAPSTLQIGTDGHVQFVAALDRHTVVGINTKNWVMIVGVGWRQVHGLADHKRSVIATACNVMQSQLIEDRNGVLEGMSEYCAGQVE